MVDVEASAGRRGEVSDLRLIGEGVYNADMLCMMRDCEGLTRSALAELTGISRREIFDYCAGKEPTPEHLELLAEALGVLPTFFYRAGEYLKRDPRYPLDMCVPLPTRKVATRDDAIALVALVPDDRLPELMEYLHDIAEYADNVTRFDDAGDSDSRER